MSRLQRAFSVGVERLFGNPSRLPLEQLVLHLLLLVGILAGLFFLMLDVIASMSWVRYLADTLQTLTFVGLYWLARVRRRHQLVSHLASVAALGYLVSNFLTNAGSDGSTWMVAITLFSLVVILQRPVASALYLLAGCGILAACLFLENQYPSWIKPYASTEARTLDFVFSFAFCVATLFLVLRMLLSFYQRSLDRNREQVEQLAQSEKLSSIGELLASMNHEIAHPITVLGMSLSLSSDWWRVEFPRTHEVLSALQPRQLDGFWNLLTQGIATARQLPPDTRTRREQVHRLTETLTASDQEAAREWAEQLVEANLTEWSPAWNDLLSDAPGKAALTFALRFLSFFLSNYHVGMAYEKLAHLVKALAEVSRTGRDENPPEPTVLSEGLDTVLTLYLAGARHTVEVVRHYEAVPVLLAYPEKLIQVWTNLVRNSLQAMQQSGVLTVMLKTLGDDLQVIIQDTGPGVPDDLKTTIFDPYFTTRTRGKGTGLGLSVCSRIVAEHQGTIEVRDAPGGGAQFIVTLPAKIDYNVDQHEP